MIGNPPYGGYLSKEEINYLLFIYELQDYQLDTYILFFERALNLIKKEGLFGMIIPNTWLVNLQYKRIRQHVFGKIKITEIVRYFQPVFPKTTVDTEVVLIRKAKPMVTHRVKITLFYKNGVTDSYEVLQSRWQATKGKPVNILERPEFIELADKLRKASRLDEFCIITQGAKPFQVGKGRPPQTRKIVSEKPFVSNTKRDSTFRPLLRGSLINRYQILWKGDYWISFGDWLAEPRYSANYDVLSKIVIRQTGDSLIATLDSNQFIVRDNLYTIIPREKNLDLRYILGLLNSHLLNWFYQTILNPEKGEALAQVKRGHLAQLPIVLPNFFNSTEKKLHDNLVALVDIMLDLNKRIQTVKGSAKEQIQRQIGKTDREIDEIVLTLWNYIGR